MYCVNLTAPCRYNQGDRTECITIPVKFATEDQCYEHADDGFNFVLHLLNDWLKENNYDAYIEDEGVEVNTTIAEDQFPAHGLDLSE